MKIIEYFNKFLIEIRTIVNEFNYKIFGIMSDDIKERNIINGILSKLHTKSNNYRIIKDNNKILIKYHSFIINIYKKTKKEEIIYKSLKYNQPLILSQNNKICQNYYEIINNEKNKDLYICIKYIDIIINLETNRYTIIKSYFNIRKPTNDKFKLFEKLINNLNNPSYYFIVNYDLNSINTIHSDIKNNIYDLNNIHITFNNNNDNNDKINFDIIMPTTFKISTNIDTKPLISNQIKKIIINDII